MHLNNEASCGEDWVRNPQRADEKSAHHLVLVSFLIQLLSPRLLPRSLSPQLEGPGQQAQLYSFLNIFQEVKDPLS